MASIPQIWIRTVQEDAKVTPTSWHYAGAGSQSRRREVKLIRCDCGYVARGDNDDQVVGMIRGHLSADHPALLDTVSREDLVSWIQAE